ncbi:hypothetical protein SAMN04487974_101350 [Pelagibacterium luteolum]|uniref:Uncharacterized protein n=1 Tax=Pelagibacterium luteolum TaxID=440168 RepID=A0A1G7S7T6_9HYPH|nr:hypothetical protein SAMN04487974_101350 [Pelagibacterium luteolum]
MRLDQQQAQLQGDETPQAATGIESALVTVPLRQAIGDAAYGYEMMLDIAYGLISSPCPEMWLDYLDRLQPELWPALRRNGWQPPRMPAYASDPIGHMQIAAPYLRKIRPLVGVDAIQTAGTPAEKQS